MEKVKDCFRNRWKYSY